MPRKSNLLIAASAAALATGATATGATLELIGQGIGLTDLSADGRVAVGNTIADNAYETWRWVDGDPNGWQRLGRATVPVFGTGAGSPDVSYDGTRVSATIVGGESGESRSIFQTCGIWTLGGGWTEQFPPFPPDCVLVDTAYADAWGLSGDGHTVVGLYWRSTNGGANGAAKPYFKPADGATVGLPTLNNDSGRVNCSSFDGTVVGGWERTPTGPWRAVAWRSGVKHLLTTFETGYSLQAEAINGDGSVIVGSTENIPAARMNPARWDWNGTEYVPTDLGVLPGTPQTFIARAWATSVTDDGSMIVGVNRFQNQGPLSIATGFVWTQEDGIRDVVDVMAEHGVALPPGSMVVSLEVSADGSTLGGIARNTLETAFLDYWSFVFRFTPLPSCDGDVNADGVVNALDFTVLAGNFGAGPGMARAAGDVSGDGFVSAADFTILAGSFGCADGLPD